LIIWLEIVDFKPMCLTFPVERNSDVGNEFESNRGARGELEETIGKSLENSEEVENEDETERGREEIR
jgi:hypothetical protein